MVSEIRVRPYTARDYPRVRGLLGDLFSEVSDSRERLEEKITRDPRSIFVARIGRQVVGSVFLIEDGRIAILSRLMTMEGMIGDRGIARALVEKAEEELASRGYTDYHVIFPVTWEDLTMHRDLGFEEEGYRYHMYKEITLPPRARR